MHSLILCLLLGQHPTVVPLIWDIQNYSCHKRVKGLTELSAILRAWEINPTPDNKDANKSVREILSDELVWLLRYGDPYLQGLSAAILSYCDDPEEIQWLAAVSVLPTVAVCLSPNLYTSQAGTRYYDMTAHNPIKAF